jgi:hypothetical protein
MAFDFKSQLAIGKVGEENFAKAYPKATRTDGRKGDFLTPNGDLVELKVDSYSPDRSLNFFMERYGNIERKSAGGPWQAFEGQVRYFVYAYASESKYYWFETIMLVQFLNEHINCFSSMHVKNTSWTGQGLLVPRTAVTHLTIEVPPCLK